MFWCLQLFTCFFNMTGVMVGSLLATWSQIKLAFNPIRKQAFLSKWLYKISEECLIGMHGSHVNLWASQIPMMEWALWLAWLGSHDCPCRFHCLTFPAEPHGVGERHYIYKNNRYLLLCLSSSRINFTFLKCNSPFLRTKKSNQRRKYHNTIISSL